MQPYSGKGCMTRFSASKYSLKHYKMEISHRLVRARKQVDFNTMDTVGSYVRKHRHKPTARVASSGQDKNAFFHFSTAVEWNSLDNGVVHTDYVTNLGYCGHQNNGQF